jgi:hypothetical protein
MLKISHGLPRHLCHAVQQLDECVRAAGHLASHPYNRADPEQSSIWWLFPKTGRLGGNWPAYEYGKLIFEKPRGKAVIRAGLHVEKGLDPVFADLAKGADRQHYRFTDAWLWPEFVSALGGEQLQTELAQIAAGCQPSPLELEVTSSSAPFEKEGDREILAGRWIFQCAPEGSQLQLVQTRRSPDANTLPGIEKVTDLDSLASTLSEATKAEDERGSWLNVFVSVPFQQASSEADLGNVWTPARLWSEVLAHFAPWIRRGEA